MPFAGLDFNMFVQDGVRGIIYLGLILIGLGIVWGVKSGKIQLVVYRYGDCGFLEILGRPLLHIKIGAWIYLEGIITQSKTSTRERVHTHIRRDLIDGQVIITQVSYVVHVLKNKDDVWKAIYKFYDEDTNLSDGHNRAFDEFIDMELGRATRSVLLENGLGGVSKDSLNALCHPELASAGVELVRVAIRESVQPNEHATGVGLAELFLAGRQGGKNTLASPSELTELGVVALKTRNGQRTA